MIQGDIPTAIAICGKGRLAASALRYLKQAAEVWNISSSLLACPVSSDHGADGWQPSLRAAAGALGVPCVTMAELTGLSGLMLLSLQYDRVIPVGRFSSERLFNIHFSLLPEYRGVYTSVLPILDGVTKVGVTLHRMEAAIDTGAVVAQRTIQLPPRVTSRSLYELYVDEALVLLTEWLPRLLSGDVSYYSQDERLAAYFGRSSLDFTALEIDLSLPAEAVERFVRAFHFPEYQLPTCNGRRVADCYIVAGTVDSGPGTCLSLDDERGTYSTGRGGVVQLVWADERGGG